MFISVYQMKVKRIINTLSRYDREMNTIDVMLINISFKHSFDQSSAK